MAIDKSEDDAPAMGAGSDDELKQTLTALPEPTGLELSPQQRAVLQGLRAIETGPLPLGDWYVGALHTLADRHNPDRISQSAQSLREILEKLPEIIQHGDVVVESYQFKSEARNIRDRLTKHRERHGSDWLSKTIDPTLIHTLRSSETFFNKYVGPSRPEQFASAALAIDPLSDLLYAHARDVRRRTMSDRFRELNLFAHHRKSDPAEFSICLESIEQILSDLLAPITADSQHEVLAILERFDGSQADIDRIFTLIESRGANTAFFFEHATNPTWMAVLRDRGYFSRPPFPETLEDGQVLHPAWPQMNYLVKVAGIHPMQVLEVIDGMPSVENRTIYYGLLAIARQMPGVYSSRLLPKIINYPEMETSSILTQLSHVVGHWATENESESALQLAKVLLDCQPPVSTIGQSDWHSAWSYAYAIENGVIPLIDADAYGTAILLADALEEALAAQRPHLNQSHETTEDLSELWQYRLDEQVQGIEQPRNALVRALALACKAVFDSQPDQVVELDQCLRDRPWAVFNRIRQYLYGSHLTEQTKPWIREMMLNHEGYGLRSYQYEFQLMVRRACEHFGPALLNVDDLEQIVDAIVAGPPKQNHYGSEDEFAQLRSIFHRKQLRPFSAVLFDRYWDYFQQLDNNNEYSLSDDNYFGLLRRGQVSEVTSQSPRSAQALSELADKDLLAYINHWEDEHELRGEGITQINIEALAKKCGEVFANSISVSNERHRFWMDNFIRIERPIYVREIVNSAKTRLETSTPELLRDWLSICEWVLTHPDEPRKNVPWSVDKSKDQPYWGAARRAVCDFVDACVRSDAHAVSECAGQITAILQALCNQYDGHLDEDAPLYGGRERWIDEAVNATRSRALSSLVTFGLRLRRNHPDADTAPVMGILDLRIGMPEGRPITRPELAMLALHYRNLLFLDEEWATAHKSQLFPQQDPGDWLASFGTFLAGNGPLKQDYEIFADDYEIALEALPELVDQGHTYTDIVDALGQHLLMYHVWGLHEVRAENSLLAQYYQRTAQDKELWASLFNFAGNRLHFVGEDFSDDQKGRFTEFFEWRLQVGDSTEIGRFSLWFRAECLEADWRLDAFLRVLDVNPFDPVFLSWRVLEDMAGTHTAKVLLCLDKMIGHVTPFGPDFQLGGNSAANIIRIALRSPDPAVRQHGELIRENLLVMGRSEFLDVGA